MPGVEVSECVASLSIRTKHLRDAFRSSTEFLLEALSDYLTDYANFKKLLLNDTEMVSTELDKFVENAAVPQWQKDVFRQVAPSLLPAALDQQRPEMEALFRTYFDEVRKVLPDAVKQGHIKSLARNPVPEPRARDYGRLRWYVRHTDRPLVLGDVGCIFETTGSRRFKPLDDNRDELIGVLLPIASRRIVVGTRYSVMPQIDLKTINRAVARCSYEFFVCSEPAPDKAALHTSIGMWAGILSDREKPQVAREIIGDIESGSLSKGDVDED